MPRMLDQYPSETWLVAAVLGCSVVACSSDNGPGGTGAGGGAGQDSSTAGTGGGGTNGAGGSSNSSDSSTPSDGMGGPTYTYTLIDDMETTTHGPIEFTGVTAPFNPGYWFNFGAGVAGDNATPPIQSFTFTALPNPTMVMGKASTKAAHQFCALNGQYDVCGVGFEFAQVPLEDAGTNPEAGARADASSDAGGNTGDAGPPMRTVPFDISAYKGIAFWGRADIETGTMDVKVLFPDTDTDPRGGVCNGLQAGIGDPNNTSRCYNSYAVQHMSFTGEWKPFVVLFKDLTIDPTFGFQQPGPFTADNAEAGQVIGSKNVYGINWQGQKNSIPDAGVVSVDIWVDDVYFIQ